MAQNYNDWQRENGYGRNDGYQGRHSSPAENPGGYGRQNDYGQQGGYNRQNDYRQQNGYGRQNDYRQQNDYSRRNDCRQQNGYGRQNDYGRQGGYAPYEDRNTAYIDPPSGSRRGRGKSNAPLIIVLVILGVGILAAGGKLLSIFLNYQKDRSAYSSLADSAVTSTVPTSYRDAPLDDPDTDESEIPIEVDWDYLSSVNSNIVGWLYCPDTVINYPVVQTSDHDFYLHHGFDDSANTSGTLFADMNSVLGVTQSQYIIYGHNMKDNSMFGTVADYVDESYYDEHPVLYYLTPTQCYRIDLFCARYVEADSDEYTTYFSSADEYQSYLDRASTDCFWWKNDIVNTDYQLFSMSTCVYPSGYVNPRLLVQGVMVPID